MMSSDYIFTLGLGASRVVVTDSLLAQVASVLSYFF